MFSRTQLSSLVHAPGHTHTPSLFIVLPRLFGIVSLESNILGPREQPGLQPLVVSHHKLDALSYLLPHSMVNEREREREKEIT